ncbi:MAG TPA: MFS transporter [Candidatus Binatia bacterium]|nr:MFS transporter [Candidatus Binatia bacterium]
MGRITLSPDGRLLFATCGVRSFAYGFLSVVLGLYLDSIGLDATAIGWIFTAALAGGALVTMVLTALADSFGRRTLLMIGAMLMALAGVAFAVTDDPTLLGIAAIFGTISPSGKEVGPFLSIEQAIIPQTTHEQSRTSVFSLYNLVGSLSGALGALAVGLPTLLSLPPIAGYRLLIWGYVSAAVVMLVLFALLSPAVEAKSASVPTHRKIGVQKSRGIVAKLSALFALDAFAGGFIVQGLVAYWFYLRYETAADVLAAIFFGANFLAALSFLAAPAMARLMGLLNTMVFTHLLSNLLLLLIPLMPNLELSVLVLLARHLLSQLDVPTRQSYTMAIIDPAERAASAGILSVARNAGAALAPLFAGTVLAAPRLGLPFLLAGSLKIIYDLWIFILFRHLRPPEESQSAAGRPATESHRPSGSQAS